MIRMEKKYNWQRIMRIHMIFKVSIIRGWGLAI